MSEIPPPPPGYGYTAQPVQYVVQRPGSGVCVAAMVLGITGLVLGFLWVIVPILAIIFAGVGLNQTKDGLRAGRGMAVTGLVTGLVGLLWWGILLLAVIGGAQ
jgi:hypothetical protein